MVDVTGDPIIEVDAGTGIGWNDVANKPEHIVSAEYPTGGNTGDVLTKTADGMAWSAGGGGGADVNAVHYTADAGKTTEQKTQARTNIGAAASLHSHAQSDVTGLVDALAGKAASVHTHAQSDVTGLETALAGKQATIADLADIRSGASAGATAYQKPASGIPKADFASAVQTSLGKADTALQEHQSLAAYRTASAQDAIDATKQDVISDISTIRSGAALGATAVQPETGKGLYPSADASKLAGIETGAQVNPSAFLKTASVSGDVLTITKQDDSTVSFTGGSYELPTASSTTLGGVKVGTNLSIDGSGVLSATDTTYSDATTSASGLMSASDKTKLAGIEAGADVTDATNVSAAGAVMRSAQASKTESQTAQVGVDANGVLWTAPGGGGGGVDYLTVQNGKICVIYEEASA